MKNRITIPVVILLAAFALTSATPSTVSAATALYFDAGGAEKLWDYLTPNWSLTSGSSYNQTWTDGYDAYFEGTGGTVNVSGTINSVNSITFNADGYTLSGGTIALTGNYGNITTNSGTATIGSVLTGSKGLTKLGNGTLILTGSNNYSGNTTIESGTLRLVGGDNRLPANTLVSISNGAVLDLNDCNQIVSGINNYGNVSLGTGTLSLIDGYSDFHGSISGEGNITFSNSAGNFYSANTYTGTTTVNASPSIGSPVCFRNPEALPGHDSEGRVIVNDGGVLAVETGSTGAWEAGDISTLLNNATFNSNSFFGINTVGAFTYGNSIDGCQGLVRHLA